jgi:UDP-sulfoquinovose synthase
VGSSPRTGGRSLKVLITGIDGYTGWPLALHLLNRGHSVVGVDNFATRRRVREVGSWSATPIPSFSRRQAAVRALLGKEISFHRGDVSRFEFLRSVLEQERPDATVHLAELRSAPYSMIDVHHAVRTQVENVGGTINLLYAMRETVPGSHLVKMGTMGEYGTPHVPIPEGFFECTYMGRTDAHLPFPRQGGSWYHLSKVHDSANVMFAARTWGLRATDVMQGVVYGIRTPDMLDDRLLTRFDFDDVWGTALNRFVVEAILGLPITPYGRGGQTRGYIALEDSVQSLRIAIEDPPTAAEYRVFNQFDAAYSVNQLAALTQRIAGEFDLHPVIEHPPDPRVEEEDHYYAPIHEELPRRGYRRTRELPDVLRELFRDLLRFRRRLAAKREAVLPRVNWREADNRPHLVAPESVPAPMPTDLSTSGTSTSASRV